MYIHIHGRFLSVIIGLTLGLFLGSGYVRDAYGQKMGFDKVEGFSFDIEVGNITSASGNSVLVDIKLINRTGTWYLVERELKDFY